MLFQNVGVLKKKTAKSQNEILFSLVYRQNKKILHQSFS